VDRRWHLELPDAIVPSVTWKPGSSPGESVAQPSGLMQQVSQESQVSRVGAPVEEYYRTYQSSKELTSKEALRKLAWLTTRCSTRLMKATTHPSDPVKKSGAPGACVPDTFYGEWLGGP